MTLNHSAIRRAYPNAVTIDDGTGAFDADGNQIQLDQALIDAAAIEVAAEQALASLRSKRNQLLAETDYLALADSTLTDEMRDYRQALRDLPANTVDPANPVWPVKPGGN
jgi:uncharacterized protein involved in exopolysaccharide biosynthesis